MTTPTTHRYSVQVWGVDDDHEYHMMDIDVPASDVLDGESAEYPDFSAASILKALRLITQVGIINYRVNHAFGTQGRGYSLETHTEDCLIHDWRVVKTTSVGSDHLYPIVG